MSAEALKRAAALMRERAEAAAPGPWHSFRYIVGVGASAPGDGDIASTWPDPEGSNAAHIASWHPAVAVAVADLLDRQARMCEEFQVDEDDDHAALAVANAYLEGAS